MPHTIKHNEKFAEFLLKENLSSVLWCGKRHTPEKIEKEMCKFYEKVSNNICRPTLEL